MDDPGPGACYAHDDIDRTAATLVLSWAPALMERFITICEREGEYTCVACLVGAVLRRDDLRPAVH